MTKTIILSAITITAILAVLLSFMPQASADDTTCIDTLATGTYENVIVPAGMRRNLANETVFTSTVIIEAVSTGLPALVPIRCRG